MNVRPLIVEGRPPMYDEIADALEPGPNAVFAWAGTIFVPYGCAGNVPADLIVHESVHFDQQAEVGGPEEWWQRYIADPAFRLGQEVEAYRAQWRMLALASSARARRESLSRLCLDLSGPMYGGLVSLHEARRLITSAV